jgi:hypothetical protein
MDLDDHIHLPQACTAKPRRITDALVAFVRAVPSQVIVLHLEQLDIDVVVATLGGFRRQDLEDLDPPGRGETSIARLSQIAQWCMRIHLIAWCHPRLSGVDEHTYV